MEATRFAFHECFYLFYDSMGSFLDIQTVQDMLVSD